jgi:ribonuclease VapC
VKSPVRVLDAYSIIAYLEGEKGRDSMISVFKEARDAGRDLLLSVVNWGEVYYITLREAGPEKAKEVVHLLSTLPVEVVSADMKLVRMAAELKATKKMSYADCFAAALASLYNAELVTGDKEFKQVEDSVKILWIV